MRLFKKGSSRKHKEKFIETADPQSLAGVDPCSVKRATRRLGRTLSPADTKAMSVIDAALRQLNCLSNIELETLLYTGKLPVQLLHLLITQPEADYAWTKTFQAIAQSSHFSCDFPRGTAWEVSAIDFAQQCLKKDQVTPVRWLINQLPNSTPKGRSQYATSLLYCIPLPRPFELPVRMSIELALFNHENRQAYKPKHNLNTYLKAHLYEFETAEHTHDFGSVELLQFSNRKIAMLNRALSSFEGALETFEALKDTNIEYELARSVLSALIRIAPAFSEELLFEMSALLDQLRMLESKQAKWPKAKPVEKIQA